MIAGSLVNHRDTETQRRPRVDLQPGVQTERVAARVRSDLRVPVPLWLIEGER